MALLSELVLATVVVLAVLLVLLVLVVLDLDLVQVSVQVWEVGSVVGLLEPDSERQHVALAS